MKRFVFFLFTLLVCSSSSFAQVLPYAKDVVQTLSSEEFKGRGYVEDGDKIAADYIKEEFIKFGLKPFNGSYFQHFNTSVNTFPREVSLIINGKELSPGEDFLVEHGSPSLSGEFEVINVSNTGIKNGLTNRVLYSLDDTVLVIDPYNKSEFNSDEKARLDNIHGYLKYNQDQRSPTTIFLTRDKLTMSGSTMRFANPAFTVLEDSIDLPVESVEVELESEYIRNYPTQNVYGYIPGQRRDSMIVLMAHYDHFGKMGKALFPGANDNASGVAMLLSLARYFSQHEPEYTTVFIAFGAEEIGLVGSKYFVEHSPFDLDKIKFLMNFDLAGTGDEGIQVVNGSVYQSEFDRLKALNSESEYLPQVKIRGSACNSDHCSFDQKGVPGFYIYTLGGIRAYHDIYDKYETLPFTEFEDYFQLVTEFLNGF